MLMLLQVPRAVSPHLLAFFFFFFQAFRFLNQRRTRGESFLGEGGGGQESTSDDTKVPKVVLMGKKQ